MTGSMADGVVYVSGTLPFDKDNNVVKDQEPVTGANAAAWGSVSGGDGIGEVDPQPKKPKLHFGGLNLKKKKHEPAPAVDFSAAPDEFDEW